VVSAFAKFIEKADRSAGETSGKKPGSKLNPERKNP